MIFLWLQVLELYEELKFCSCGLAGLCEQEPVLIAQRRKKKRLELIQLLIIADHLLASA